VAARIPFGVARAVEWARMTENWLTTSWTEAWLVVISSVGILVAVIATIRIVGLRSLSKMSGFDFAVTVAIGSIVASVAATPRSLPNGALAVAALLGAQAVISWRRQRGHLGRIVDNTALLLMRDGEFLPDALRRSRVTEDDVIAKLRAANVLRLSEVRAVILETTGDISVLHGDAAVDDRLLDGVRTA
jgi:uncharacterized membrane protein YcaP (DUF421 family)